MNLYLNKFNNINESVIPALEIVFVTIFIPILVVGITTFTVQDFVLFNFMEPLILEWWEELFE